MSDLASAARAVLDRVDELERGSWLLPVVVDPSVPPGMVFFRDGERGEVGRIVSVDRSADWSDATVGWEHDGRL